MCRNQVLEKLSPDRFSPRALEMPQEHGFLLLGLIIPIHIKGIRNATPPETAVPTPHDSALLGLCRLLPPGLGQQEDLLGGQRVGRGS